MKSLIHAKDFTKFREIRQTRLLKEGKGNFDCNCCMIEILLLILEWHVYEK